MVWFKVDDGLAFHRKTVAAGNAAMGLWLRAGAWSAGELTDGFIPRHMATTLGTRSQAERLVKVGLWTAVEGGYQFHEWGEGGRQPTRASVMAERAYNARSAALHRDPELTAAVRQRDQNRCRFCGTLVNWKDRRSGAGGTYRVLDPSKPPTLANVVVACRFCIIGNANDLFNLETRALLPAGGFGETDSEPAGQASAYLEPLQIGARSEPDQIKAPTRPVSTSSRDLGSSSPVDQRTEDQDRQEAEDPQSRRNGARLTRDEPTGPKISQAANKIVQAYAATCRRRPAGTWLGRLGVEVDGLLGADWTEAEIADAVSELGKRGLTPSLLSSVAHELVNSDKASDKPRNVYEVPDDQLTEADIEEILGPVAQDPDLPRSSPEDVKTRAALAAWREREFPRFQAKRRERAIALRRERLARAAARGPE